MSSINLSFREWPFLSLNRSTESTNLKSPSLTGEVEKLKTNVPVYLTASNAYVSMRSSQPFIRTQPFEDIIPENSNPNKNQNYHLSSWGRCGLYASTNESCLSIFSNDEKGNLTPMFMFSPYEKLSIGKINKQPQKASNITAIGWSDGHLQPSIPKPILAISSEKGHLKIYDFNTTEKIANYRFNEPIVSILWSSYKENRFYAGSRSGHFYICEVNNRKTIEIIKMLDFSIKSSSSSSEIVSKSIDFITQDDIDGNTVGIASKEGLFGFITNINDQKQLKLQVFQNFNFKETTDSLNFFEFYPNNQDFVTVATNKETFLISISKGILLPFIQTSNCKFISLIDNENDKVIVGDENEITVWKLVNQFWVRLNNLNIGVKQILTFSKHDGKILMTTASNWLTEVEYKKNKIFITKRIKMIDGCPVDFGIGDGSIAFLTSNNTISFTQKTPESVIDPLFGEKNGSESSDESSQNYQNSENSNTDDYSDAPLYVNIESEGIDLDKSKSMTINISSDSLKQTFDDSEDICLSTVKSESDILSKRSSINNCKFDDTIHGNSNSLVLSFNINNNDIKLKNIEWISSQKVVAWCKKDMFLIDLEKRIITKPLSKKFCQKSINITQLFFSKSRRIMCIVLSYKQAYFFDTESNFDIIKSFDLSDKIKTENKSLLGSISPNEDQFVFVSENSIFFSNLSEKDSLKEINSVLDFRVSFISWRKHGILVGTEKGCAFLITNKKIDEINSKSKMNRKDVKVIFNSSNTNKQKLCSIKLILPFANKSFIILDSNEQGIIVSNKNQRIIAENIKAFKQCSKNSFLVRLQNYNKIIAINTSGDFKTAPPPCFFSSSQKTTNKINLLNTIKDINIKDNDDNLIDSIYHHIFSTNKTNQSISLRNSVQLLNQFISFHDNFNSLSSKTYLKLGNLEKARNMFLNTNPNDKEYLNNMMLAALYNSNSDKSESVQLVVKNLLTNNLINEAVDVLLITNDIYSAAEVLSNNGRNKDAYHVLMLNEKINDCGNYKEIVYKIANSLITKKENVLFGLKLLSSYGYFQEMINYLSLNII